MTYEQAEAIVNSLHTLVFIGYILIAVAGMIFGNLLVKR